MKSMDVYLFPGNVYFIVIGEDEENNIFVYSDDEKCFSVARETFNNGVFLGNLTENEKLIRNFKKNNI